jgi:AcrR family transcriptional regulator
MKDDESRKWRADDPRRLRMAEKRAAILVAAAPILLREGFGGTTLDRVATEGGIAKMTLYRHFPSKETLFEGLVTSMCETMRMGLAAAPLGDRDRPGADRLADELRGFTAGVIQPEWLALYRLIVADGWRFPALARAFEQAGMQGIRRRIADLIETAGVPATRSSEIAGEVVALALGDAYQRALLGIAGEEQGAAFDRQIDAAVTHAFSNKGEP